MKLIQRGIERIRYQILHQLHHSGWRLGEHKIKGFHLDNLLLQTNPLFNIRYKETLSLDIYIV